MQKEITDEKISEILTILNRDYTDDILEDSITVAGLHFSHYEESSMHSKKVTETLNGEDVSFTREGYKEISYDHWVNTHWCDWE